MFIKKNEIKLFLTFLIIYVLFAHWIGWNEYSSFDVTRAIVDEGRLEIDNYINETGDRSFFNNRYYIAASPTLGFVSLPIYSALKFLFNVFNIPNQYSGEFVEYILFGGKFLAYANPGSLILTSMIFLTIFTSGIFGALSVLIFYRILGFYTNVEKYKILLVLVYGLGSLVFPLSLVFYRSAILMFFTLFSFYFLKKGGNSSRFLYSGIFLGFSISIEYSALIVGILLTIISFKYSVKRSKWFLVGIILGLLPLFLYNFVVFKNPFDISLKYLDINVWPDPYGTKAYIIFEPDISVFLKVIWSLPFGTYRGLFFYYPIFLFSLIGFYYFWKKYKLESLIFLSIFIGLLIANSFLFEWWGGGIFGPRYLIIALPFLLIPLIILFENKWNKTFLLIFLILLVISIFHNFLGLQDIEDIRLIFNYKINKYEISSYDPNPIYQHYFPLFLKNGPRSRILEELLLNLTKIDIRDFVQQQPTSGIKFIVTPIGFLAFNLQILPMVLVILAVFFIWKKEIIHLIPKKYVYLLYLILFVTFLLGLDLRTINYSENWYPIYKNETFTDPYRWMSQNGTIYIFSNQDQSLFLNSTIIPFNKSRKLDLYLNGNFANQYFIPYESLELKINVKNGENVITLYSENGCDYHNNTSCLSFAISNFTLFDSEKLEKNNEIFFGENWYNIYGNERWMSQNGTIYIFSNQDQSLFLNSTIIPFNKSRKLDLYLNGNFANQYFIPYESLELKINVKNGENVITLYSENGCDYHNNTSCLSFAISNFTLFDSEKLEKNNEIFFGENWYNIYGNERWMSQNGTIYIFSQKKQDFIFNISGVSYNKTRNIEIFLNGNLIDTFNTSYFAKKVSLNSGENTFVLHSREECELAKTVNSSDLICLSFGIEYFKLHSVSELQKQNAVIFGENWYPIYKNETYTDPYRWMSQNGTIYIFSKGNNQTILSFSFKGYGDQTFDLILNNKTINFYSNNLTYSELVQLNPGENVLLIHSHEGCHPLPELTDVCLSVGISNFQVLTKENLKVNAMIWDQNWYNEDIIGNLTCRWMGQNSTIYLIDSGNESKQINLTFIGWSYYKPRTLQISFGNDSKEMAFSTAPQEFSIKLRNLKTNVLKFASKEGCDVPARIENSSDDRCLSIAFCQSIVHNKT